MKVCRVDNLTTEKEEEKIILDSALFTAGQTVEGLAFIKSYNIATDKNGKEYVRLYFKDKNYKTFQGNIINVNNLGFSAAKLNEIVGKVCLVSGSVSPFLNMNIINIISLSIAKDFVLTEKDFMPEIKSLNELKNTLVNLVDNNTIDVLEPLCATIKDLKCIDQLENSFLTSDFPLKGSPLLLTLETIKALHLYDKHVASIADLSFKKYFTILVLGIFSILDTNAETKPVLLDERNLKNYHNLSSMLEDKRAFGTVYQVLGMKEFNHLYSCKYFNEEPKTLLAKIILQEYNRISSEMSAVTLDNVVSDDDMRTFNNVVHVKLKGVIK